MLLAKPLSSTCSMSALSESGEFRIQENLRLVSFEFLAEHS
jgi:hypothetical protein